MADGGTHYSVIRLDCAFSLCSQEGEVQIDEYASFTFWGIRLPKEDVVERDIAVEDPPLEKSLVRWGEA